MIQIKLSYRHLILWDPDGKNQNLTISFYMCGFNSGPRVGFLSGFNHSINHSIKPLEELLDVIPEPYLNCLLFNLELVEELKQLVIDIEKDVIKL